MSPRYRRRESIVDALQWRPTDEPAKGELLAWLEANGTMPAFGVTTGGDEILMFATRPGSLSAGMARVAPGDWVIAEPDGAGFYPVAGVVFDELYEEADP